MSWRAMLAEVLNEEPDRTAAKSLRQEPASQLLERMSELRRSTQPAGAGTAAWARALIMAELRVAKWGGAALAVGWTVDDLLGVDPAAWMRLDRRGVFLLHEEAEVAAITRDTIALQIGRDLLHHRRRLG